MPQFDVYRNQNPKSQAHIPYLLDVQADLLDPIATRVVVPLALVSVLQNKPAQRLNPVFEIENQAVVMLTQELAGINRKLLTQKVANLTAKREEILAAVDFLVCGI